MEAHRATVVALRRARWSISFIFFINGFTVASWLPHIPEVKERLALGEFHLGIALLAMAVGSVLALPFAGWLSGRFGSDAATRMAGLLLCLLLPAPVLAPTLPMLMLALLLFGTANALLDVAMNAQGLLIEDRYQRPIFSTLHGLFSAGGLVGASLAGLAASVGIAAPFHALGLAGFLTWLLLAATRSLLRDQAGKADADTVLALPSGALIGLGALAFLALMAEGAIGDWAAVFLREVRDAGMGSPAIGFAGFSLAMAVGRFGGDWARRHWSPTILLRTSGLVCALGMAMALTAPGLAGSVLGFTFFGLGLANMIPILFAAAGRAKGVTTGLGIAAVATAGYGGFLAGPPVIGFAAELIGLQLALVVILLGVLVIAIFADLARDRAEIALVAAES
jgi:MFS family permease